MRRAVGIGLTLALLVYWPARAQQQQSLGDVARKLAAEKAAHPEKKTKVITNDDLTFGTGATSVAAPKDPVAIAFVNRISGRWLFMGYHRNNTSWWWDHGSDTPKTEIDYLFGPTELLIQKKPEMDRPSIIARFAYGSVRQVSNFLFDVELYPASNPTAVETERFKLSTDGRTLEISADAAKGISPPTVQDLRLINDKWSPDEAN